MTIDAQLLRLLTCLREHTDIEVSEIGAALLAAYHLKIAQDTRSLAAAFEIPHAIAIRECVVLGGEDLVTILDKKERSGRLFFHPCERMKTILNACEGI